jgi:hypothetical protein
MSSFEEGQKQVDDIIHFLAYQGHTKEMKVILLLGQREYGINVGQNISLKIRLNIALAERLTNEVIH